MNQNKAILMLHRFLMLLLTASLTTFAQTADNTKTIAVNNAAKVALVEGDVKIMGKGQPPRSVKVGDMIVEGDGIKTGADGELQLDMQDGGYIAVRANTTMRITKYQANGDANDTGVFHLLEGGFRSVSGWIGKFNRSKYLVHTPSATVGIRGTDHEPMVVIKDSPEQEAGTYDKVNEGASYIRTSAGSAEISPNQAGFVSAKGRAAPRVLATIPKIFRATRNEHLLLGKHAAVQAAIEKRRTDRQTEIKSTITKAKADAASRQAERTQQREAAKKEREQARAKQREEARAAKAGKTNNKVEKKIK